MKTAIVIETRGNKGIPLIGAPISDLDPTRVDLERGKENGKGRMSGEKKRMRHERTISSKHSSKDSNSE